MENNHAEKSQAELYREERKKRIDSAAKKKAKKNPKAAKAKRVAAKVIGIVLAVAIVLGAAYAVLNFFGVPQKVLTAATIGDEKVSVAKYNFYYMDLYMSVQQTSSQYDSQYGDGYGAMYTGYDSSLTPMEQEYPEELEGYEGEGNPTWADYFRINTLNSLQSYLAYADMAREAGLTLTEDEQAEIDEQIESLRSTAESNDYSLNRWLTRLYGKGVNEDLLREVLEERYLASNYAQQKSEELTDAVTEDEINAEYTENIADYAELSVSLFTVSADTSSISEDATEEEQEAARTEAMAEAKSEADRYAAQVTDAATLLEQAQAYNSTATESGVTQTDVTASTLESTYGTNVRDWVLADGRAVGDVGVVESDSGYTVIYMAELPHQDTTKPVDVRHILIQFETKTDDEGNTVELTDEQKATYYAQAEEIYQQFLDNPTEDNFAALANENSDDPGSNENGGLYEDVQPGEMAEAFDNWIFDPARQPGDSGIVETEIGYHIMYYVGNDNEEVWKSTVRTALANEAVTAFDEEIINGETYQIDASSMMVNWSVSQLESLITDTYIASNYNS